MQKQGNSAWRSGCSCGFSSEGFGLAPGRNILTIPVICGCLRCLLWDRSQAAVSAGGWSVLSARAELSASFLPKGIQFAGGKTTWRTQPKCGKAGALQEFISKLHPCTKHSGVDPAAATLKMGVSVSSSSPRPFQPAPNTTAILPFALARLAQLSSYLCRVTACWCWGGCRTPGSCP